MTVFIPAEKHETLHTLLHSWLECERDSLLHGCVPSSRQDNWLHCFLEM
jgi:hypothetical protein